MCSQPLLSHMCFCLTVSFSPICLAYLSLCPVSFDYCVSLKTVSPTSLGGFDLIFPSWWFVEGLVGRRNQTIIFFSLLWQGSLLFKSKIDGKFSNKGQVWEDLFWNIYSTVVNCCLCNTSQIWLNLDSLVKQLPLPNLVAKRLFTKSDCSLLEVWGKSAWKDWFTWLLRRLKWLREVSQCWVSWS